MISKQDNFSSIPKKNISVAGINIMHIFVHLIVDVFKTSLDRLSLIVNGRKKTLYEYLFAGLSTIFFDVSDICVFLIHIKEYQRTFRSRFQNNYRSREFQQILHSVYNSFFYWNCPNIITKCFIFCLSFDNKWQIENNPQT